MKIENLILEKKNGRARASARVIWEDCGRKAQEVFFETELEFADGFSANPNAFLVGCIMPAMLYGEKRVLLDAEVCPELKDGLITVMGWMRYWYYGPDKPLVQIEVKKPSSLPLPSAHKRAALFFSGGIDSLATLRVNRINYPQGHPGSIKDGLLVYGLEVTKPEKFDYVLKSVSEIARDAGVTLIPVYTNLRDIGPEDVAEFWGDFWTDKFEGAVFSAVAHTFSRRINKVYINSSFDIPNLHPHGSHPLIDPNYSSYDLKILHEGIALSRFDKTRLIADWDTALQHLRVCNMSLEYQPGVLNCGECEKCVRTMLTLMALGVLEKAHAFQRHEISTELLNSAICMNKTTMPFYGELLEPLEAIGRHDLVRVIKRRMAIRKWRDRTIEPVRKFDDIFLKGNLLKLKRSVYKKGILAR